MKVRKILLWAGGIVLGLVLVLWFGGWGLLKSPLARSKASAELTKMLGVPVEVDTLDVGGSRTSASLRIPDDAANDNLVKIGSLDTDITLGGLLGGNASPTYVNASDVDFLLRVDEKGQILSPFPKEKTGQHTQTTIPEIRVKSGKVRIRQQGKEEFALSGVSAHLRRDGDGYALDGDIDDPKWGKWKVGGRLTADLSDGRVTLSNERAELKDELLRTIPYVPNVVWEHIGASGQTAATVAFTYKPGTDLGYSVELKPHKASLRLPDPGITLTDVQGDILVADGKVAVTDGKVSLAGGGGTLSGEYVFWKKGVAGTSADEPTAVITVKAEANGIDVTRLPEKWGLPKELEGKLKGTADLELRIDADGTLDTRGGGDAEVVGAKLKNIPFEEFKFKLVGGEGGYRFQGGAAGN